MLEFLVQLLPIIAFALVFSTVIILAIRNAQANSEKKSLQRDLDDERKKFADLFETHCNLDIKYRGLKTSTSTTTALLQSEIDENKKQIASLKRTIKRLEKLKENTAKTSEEPKIVVKNENAEVDNIDKKTKTTKTQTRTPKKDVKSEGDTKTKSKDAKDKNTATKQESVVSESRKTNARGSVKKTKNTK